MIISLNRLNTFLVFSYILLVFFLIPVKNQNIVEGLFLIITLIIIFLRLFFVNNSKSKLVFERKEILLFIYLLLTYTLILIASKYSKVYITINFLYLIVIYYYFGKDKIIINKNRKHIYIYIVMCLSLIFQFFLYFKNNVEIWHLSTTWDKNYSGVILFLFFLFCNKNNYKIGKVLVLLPALFLGSRGYILMIILFYIMKYFKKSIFKAKKLMFFKNIFRVFMLMFAIIYIFSNFWVNNIASVNLKQYQEGINDTSNKMRFLANLKTFDLIKNDKHLLLYGYDNDLKEVLGIESENYSEHETFEGLRLVQTHNSILNIIIKSGILFSVLYFLALAKVIDKYYKLENIEYIFPFLVNSMIMHSLLNGALLFFWILILHMPQRVVVRK